MKRSALGWIALLAVLGILVAAWIDGGEEPLRPMSHSVQVPESAL
ncbi:MULTISPECIES: hypothetical protein [Qipengyuania]|nr:hypothetical protein [Qipengyuania aestuarii]